MPVRCTAHCGGGKRRSIAHVLQVRCTVGTISRAAAQNYVLFGVRYGLVAARSLRALSPISGGVCYVEVSRQKAVSERPLIIMNLQKEGGEVAVGVRTTAYLAYGAGLTVQRVAVLSAQVGV